MLLANVMYINKESTTHMHGARFTKNLLIVIHQSS